MNNFIRLKIAFQLAWRSLRLNILRTSLTVLGVIIGTTAIVVVFAAGDALQKLILNEVESYGTDIIQTEIRVPTAKSEFAVGEVTTLKLSDMEAIDRLANIKRSYAMLIGQQRVSYANQGKSVLLFGVSANYAIIDQKSQTTAGRFFDQEEDNVQAQVAVLGSKLKENLFGDQEAVGQQISVGNGKFRVIGVLEERGSAAGFIDFDDSLYIPVQTLQKRILGVDHVISFVHQLNDIDRAEETAEEVSLLLRERHDISDPSRDDFRVSTMEEALEIVNMVTGTVTLLLLAIVLISLLVGGVGIMNIMYVTVTERTPEIGLRKAMGANSFDVVSQFLIEAMLITFWGWLMGVGLGLIISRILIWVASSALNISLTFIWPLNGILVAFIFALICGLLFGLRPAQKAAKLDPVEALRTE